MCVCISRLILSVRLEKRLLWLKRPMRERQTLPQRSHRCVVSGLLESLPVC